jgi:hypothetical protein
MHAPVDDADDTPGPAVAAAAPLLAAAWALLALLVVLGAWHASPPAPVPASAPLDCYSAERALSHLPQIAAEPHPVGSAANARTRAYLVQTLQGLGWETRTQEEFGVSQEDGAVGYVSNVVARLRGTGGGGKALMLVAHHDSVPTGPGAADDGAAVAAILETARALKSLPPLRNDLIVLFTDAEEAGLLGAEAFVTRHPWARDVAVVLNFEYRGNSGAAIMFETSAGNGRLVEAFAALPLPVGTSLMAEIYRLMPNRTDFSVFKRAGMAGMNFASIDQAASYHSELDRAEFVDGRSVQHQGETMLALARRLGDADLGGLAAPDRVYFDLRGLGLLHYLPALAWALTALVLVLWVAAFALGLRRGGVRFGGTAIGAVAVLCTAVLLAVGATAVLLFIRSLHPEYRGLQELYNPAWYWLALLALALAAFVAAYGRLQRRWRALELALGGALVWLALLLAATVALPGASYALAWPLAGVLVSWIVLLRADQGGLDANRQVLVLTAGAIPAVVVHAPLVQTLLLALTTPLAGVAVFASVLLLALLWPLLALTRRPALVCRVAVAAAVVLLAGGEFTSGASAERPRPVNVFYVRDGGTGTAQWLSSDQVLDPWQGHFFDAGAVRRRIPEWFGADSRLYWTSAAPDLPLAAPELQTLGDRTDGATRTLELRLKSRRNARDFKLQVVGNRVAQALVQGQAVPPAAADDWSLAAYNLPPEGVTLTLRVAAGRPFTVNLFDITPGLPLADKLPRDGKQMAHRTESSDTTQSLATYRFQ